MSLLVKLDHVQYQQSGKHTIDFCNAASALRDKTDFEGTVRAYVCDEVDDGMELIRKEFLDQVKGAHWYNSQFADSITLCCKFSKIEANGAVWLPCSIGGTSTQIHLLGK